MIEERVTNLQRVTNFQICMKAIWTNHHLATLGDANLLPNEVAVLWK